MVRISAFFVFVAVFSAVSALAETPSPIPGWTHGGSMGARAAGGPIVHSSPVAAELDGDPSDGKEVAVASADGTVQVLHADGSILWSAKTPNSTCGASNDRIYSSPAVGALNGDGEMFVVIGYGGFAGAECDGGVVAYHGKDGSVAWTLSLTEFAHRNKFGTAHHGVYSTPALADADRNGKLVIGFGSLDRNVYLLNHDGTVRWWYNAADTVFSSPAFVNIDNDRNLEMIIGTDISQNTALRPPTKNGGFLYAFKTTLPRGRDKHITFNAPGAYVWRRYFNQVIQSSPTIADVMPGRPGPEILIGSGCFFPQNSSVKNGDWVKILNPRNGALLQTLNAPGCLTSSPAVGDLDNDGVQEIVATVNAPTKPSNDHRSQIVAWKADSPHPIWMTAPSPGGLNDQAGGTLESPVIADLDGNGSLEVIAANGHGIAILNGRTGAPYTCQSGSCASNFLTLQTGGPVGSTPLIDDINGDGVLDLIIGGQSNGHGIVYGWSFFNALLHSPAGSHAAYSRPSPMFRGNIRRDGVNNGAS